MLQSPEASTVGVLLDAEGVQSRKGARIFTCSAKYEAALRAAGLSSNRSQNGHQADEETQQEAAIAGV